QSRFDELRLRQRRGDAENRLAREKCGALGDGMDFARESECAEIIEKVVVKSARALEPTDIGGREAKIFEKTQRLLQSGGEQESAPRRQTAHEQLEYRGAGVAMIQIGLNHVDLIKISQQRTCCGFQSATLSAALINPGCDRIRPAHRWKEW